MPCGFYKRTPEIKAKNSIATKKLWEDSEYRKNFKGNSGHHHSEFTKRKMSESQPENLITLCRSCHSETNSDRKVWVKFFSQKLKFA